MLFPPRPAPPLSCSDTIKTQLLSLGADKPSIIKSAARTMREKYRLHEYDCLYAIAGVLLQDDQDNGHGLYFAGEYWRAKAMQQPQHNEIDRKQMRDHFFRYLDIEPTIAASERDGKAPACYQREKGYCAERTAWINHLMANDYYEEGLWATDNDIKRKRFQRALEFVETELEQFGEFDQVIPSSVLQGKIKEELQRLDVTKTQRSTRSNP